MHGFWDITFGNVVTIGALLLSFWTAHRSNVKRIEDQAGRMATLETQVKTLYDWWSKTWGVPQVPHSEHGD
jgi:hypothetical protein